MLTPIFMKFPDGGLSGLVELTWNHPADNLLPLAPLLHKVSGNYSKITHLHTFRIPKKSDWSQTREKKSMAIFESRVLWKSFGILATDVYQNRQPHCGKSDLKTEIINSGKSNAPDVFQVLCSSTNRRLIQVIII